MKAKCPIELGKDKALNLFIVYITRIENKCGENCKDLDAFWHFFKRTPLITVHTAIKEAEGWIKGQYLPSEANSLNARQEVLDWAKSKFQEQ